MSVDLPADRTPVREDLADLEPYGAPQLDVAVRLNTNETAEPPPPGFLAAVAQRLPAVKLNRYPDRRATRLRTLLGEVHDLGPNRVWAANGSNEVLQQLLQAYGGPGRTLLTTRPGYSMYPVLGRVTATNVVEVDLDDEFLLTPDAAAAAVAEHDPHVVFVANPNNPTGIPLALDVVVALHDAGQGLVVVDEAYVEFGGESAVRLLDELPRLVVSRTFSKAYRMAGLRLGYMYAAPWVIDDLRRVRLPYHLDALKQVAAEVAVEQRNTLLTHLADVARERERVHAALVAMPGIVPIPSVANFILFRCDVAGVWQGLLDRGVLVRDFSSKPRLQGCQRVTIGTPVENDAFLAALGDVVADGQPA